MTTPLRAAQSGLGVASAVLVAVALGFTAAHVGGGDPGLAVVVCLVPLVPVLLARPDLAVLVALALLPFGTNLVGSAADGLNVAPSDLLLATTLAGLLVRLGRDQVMRARLSVLRPVVPLLGVYLMAALLVTVAHPSFATFVNLLQRVEVVGIPLLAGAVLLDDRTARRGLMLFSSAAVVLALAYLASASDVVLGVQKNPAGQFIVDAALLAVGLFGPKPARLVVFPVLVVGAFSAQSRGALIGMLVGLALLVVLRSRNPLQVLVRLLPPALLVIGVYYTLPVEAQNQIFGRTASAEFNDKVRRAYIDDAEATIAAHPIVGVGIGNYIAGNSSDLTQTTDPHNIALLETAEGGAVLITGFVVLQGGTMVVLVRRRRHNVWVAPAVAVQASILAHSLFDIYWVRGTPVLGWLLVGLALAARGGVTGPDGPAAAEAARPIGRSGTRTSAARP